MLTRTERRESSAAHVRAKLRIAALLPAQTLSPGDALAAVLEERTIAERLAVELSHCPLFREVTAFVTTERKKPVQPAASTSRSTSATVVRVSSSRTASSTLSYTFRIVARFPNPTGHSWSGVARCIAKRRPGSTAS